MPSTRNDIHPVVDLFVLCWNEEKILPYFLNYYSQYVNTIHIIDNESTDSSLEIIKRYSNTTIETYHSNFQIRDDKYLEIKNNIWRKSSADIVIVCDMDEFLYHPNLKLFIKEFHDSVYTIIYPVGYDMITENFNFDYEKQLTDVVTEGYLNPMFNKMVMFKPRYIQSVNYNFGGHNASPIGSVVINNNPELKLLHYKRLGRDYYLSKMKSYKNRVSNFNLRNWLGYEYQFETDKHNSDFNTQLLNKIKII